MQGELYSASRTMQGKDDLRRVSCPPDSQVQKVHQGEKSKIGGLGRYSASYYRRLGIGQIAYIGDMLHSHAPPACLSSVTLMPCTNGWMRRSVFIVQSITFTLARHAGPPTTNACRTSDCYGMDPSPSLNGLGIGRSSGSRAALVAA